MPSFTVTFMKVLIVAHLGWANVIPSKDSSLKETKQEIALGRDVILGVDDNFDCPGYGVWPHPERCELYYTCYLGEPTYLWQCRKDYLFDLRYDGCNFPELTDCGDRTRPDGTMTTTTTTARPPTPNFTCPADNGFFPAEPGVCQSQFYICVDNVAFLEKCPGDSIFDPYLLVCLPSDSANCEGTSTPTTSTTTTTSTETTTTEGPFVCPSENGVFPIRPEACTPFYYRCEDGEPYPTTCPGDQIFEPSQSLCVAPESATCTGFICPTPDGFYPFANCSEKYYTCIASKPYIQTCPPGSVFDPAGGYCATENQVPSCSNNSTTAASTPTVTSSTTPIPTPGGNFTCPTENGSFPDPTDCHRFYVCAWGTPYLKVCPGDLYYNPAIEVCDYQENVPSCVNGVPQNDPKII